MHNVDKDNEPGRPYTKEECAQYLDHLPEIFEHAGSKITKEAFLDSWTTIVQHASSLLDKAEPNPETVTSPAGPSDVHTRDTEAGAENSPETRVSDDETYITKLNNIWIHTGTNYLGEPADLAGVATPEETIDNTISPLNGKTG